MVFKIAVFGLSCEIYIWRGHAALIVDKRLLGCARVFDWGIFSYSTIIFLGILFVARV